MTRPLQLSLSVVIPFYQEEANIEPLFQELLPVLQGLSGAANAYEVIAVDDGSTDGTLSELLKVSGNSTAVRVLSLGKNCGQTAAFEAGFSEARGALIVTMDGDLQIDPADIPRMIDHLAKEQVDFVFGWRKDRKDSRLKRWSTKGANAIRNWLTGEQIPDTGCPLKVFKREVIQRMKLFDGMHRFFITLAHMDGWCSSQMIVRHRHRQHGRSKYGFWNRVLRAFRDCLVVRWMMSRHLRYRVSEKFATRSAAARERSPRGSASEDLFHEEGGS